MPSKKSDKEESKTNSKKGSTKGSTKGDGKSEDKKEAGTEPKFKDPMVMGSKENIVSHRDGNDRPERIAIPEGDMVGDFKVIHPIESETGLNTIFVVEDKKKDKYALKVERQDDKHGTLRVELFILMQMEKVPNGKHFCKIQDRGTNKEFNWVALTLSGKSLRILRKESKDQRFSIGCALSVGQQCLKGLEVLHSMGFIHRDVNPTNFAIGRPEVKQQRLVYCLDFGFAHQYKSPTGELKKPREKPWKFLGSPRHATRNCYLNKELSRADDLEMWLYMVVEFCKGSLPWMNQRNPKEIFEWQKAARQGFGLREFLGGLPIEFLQIMKSIDKLTFYDEPNYKEIYGLIGNAIVMCGCNEFPYDWENEKKEEAPAAAPAAAAAAPAKAEEKK